MNKKFIIIAIPLFMTFNCMALAQKNATKNIVINEIKVTNELYPKGFENEFQNNLNFFIDGIGVDKLAKVPYDTIVVDGNKITHKYYTNTTEIGLYLNILAESAKSGNKAAIVRISETLSTLEQAPKWKGLFYWPYDINDGKLLKNKDEIIPAVDNGNFSFALVGVAGALMSLNDPESKEIIARIDTILKNQREGYVALYDKNRGLLSSGYSTKNNSFLGYHIDRKANESRTAVIWAILDTQHMGNKAIPENAFYNMKLYTKSYLINGKSYNPLLTWDGAYFQMMLPQIWINEHELMPDYSIVKDHTSLQKMYANKYAIPMVSSSATIDNGYHSFGVPQLSESKIIFNNKIIDGNTGTPHAVALSYIVDSNDAIKALKKIKMTYPQVESPYGWFDAIDNKGNITQNIISLDVGMFIGAILSKEINADVTRYLDNKGYIQKLQHLYKGFVPNS